MIKSHDLTHNNLQMSALAQLPVMDFFCIIALRDWFINLCDRILRAAAGEQALDHYWPCGRCVSPPTRRFVTSLGKCLQGGCGTNNEPRPLASPVLFCFVFSHGLILTLSWVINARTEVLILTAYSQAIANQSTNQIRESTQLQSRLDYPCFQVSNRGVYFQLS